MYSLTEATLTLENLTSLLEGVRVLDIMADFLHIPDNKQVEIRRQYSNISQQKQEYWQYFLSQHPTPSWLIVADALYLTGEHGALEVLRKLYLKGRPHVVAIKKFL